jgi:hypothetical protein
MPPSPAHRPFLVGRNPARLGLHLVQPVKMKKSYSIDLSDRFCKIAAVGAALFLVLTI